MSTAPTIDPIDRLAAETDTVNLLTAEDAAIVTRLRELRAEFVGRAAELQERRAELRAQMLAAEDRIQSLIEANPELFREPEEGVGDVLG